MLPLPMLGIACSAVWRVAALVLYAATITLLPKARGNEPPVGVPVIVMV